MINIKRDFGYLLIIFLLICIDLGLFLYFGVFNKKVNNNTPDAYDKGYNWVLSDLNKKVDQVDNIDITDDMVNKDSIEISSNISMEYKGVTTMPYSLYDYNGYLGLNLSLSDNHIIDIILISVSSKAYKYNVRSIGSSDTKVIYYKDLPKGQYRIFINDNDNKYDTMQYIIIE